MKKKRIKNILVFFSYKYDLKKWFKAGILDREVKYYENLIKKGNFNITFLTYGDNNDKNYLPKNSKIKVINIFKKKINNSFLCFFYSIFFIFINKKLDNFDLFKTNQNYGSWLAVIAKKLYKKPLVSRSGYDLFHFKLQEKNYLKIFLSYFICLLVYRSADKIFIPSLFYKKFLIQKYKINESKINILPNYIDIQNFKFNKRENKKNNKFLFLGRFEKQKNINYLIDLFKINKSYNLDIIGDGSEFNKIKVKSSPYKNIKIIKKRFLNNEINNLMNNYNFFILPSYYEGCPKILLEAMFNGMICLVFDLPNISEIVKDGHNGIYLNNDINKMSKKLYNLNSLNFSNLSKNASLFIRSNYIIDLILKKEIKTYENIIY